MAATARGITLIELLTTLAVGGLLLCLAVPDFAALLNESRATSSVNRLLGHIQLARASAIQFRRITTLCAIAPTNVGGCGDDWHRGYQVFVDSNGDARIDANVDQVIAQGNAQRDIAIDWRAFRRRPYLQFDANGLTRTMNGSFVICARGEITASRRIVLNLAGRARIARERPGQGPTC